MHSSPQLQNVLLCCKNEVPKRSRAALLGTFFIFYTITAGTVRIGEQVSDDPWKVNSPEVNFLWDYWSVRLQNQDILRQVTASQSQLGLKFPKKSISCISPLNSFGNGLVDIQSMLAFSMAQQQFTVVSYFSGAERNESSNNEIKVAVGAVGGTHV